VRRRFNRMPQSVSRCPAHGEDSSRHRGGAQCW